MRWSRCRSGSPAPSGPIPATSYRRRSRPSAGRAGSRWEGVLMCLPQNVSSLVVYYNRDLFRRFRVAEPTAGWTWTEFVIRAVNLTRDAQGRPVSAGDPELGAIRPAIFGLGVEP